MSALRLPVVVAPETQLNANRLSFFGAWECVVSEIALLDLLKQGEILKYSLNATVRVVYGESGTRLVVIEDDGYGLLKSRDFFATTRSVDQGGHEKAPTKARDVFSLLKYHHHSLDSTGITWSIFNVKNCPQFSPLVTIMSSERSLPPRNRDKRRETTRNDEKRLLISSRNGEREAKWDEG